MPVFAPGECGDGQFLPMGVWIFGTNSSRKQMDARTIRKYAKRYGRQPEPYRTPRRGRVRSGYFAQDSDLLLSAHNAWAAMEEWRRMIARNEEFIFGDQFADLKWDERKCAWIRERTMYQQMGLNPSQYNIVRNILRTVEGVWSSVKTTPVCIAHTDDHQEESEVLSATLKTIYNKDELNKLDLAELKQLMVTGLAVVRCGWAARDNSVDVVNDYVDPYCFFCDTAMRDPRYQDCSLVGAFYDLSIDDIVRLFAKGDKGRAVQLRGAYGEAAHRDERVEEFARSIESRGGEDRLNLDFYTPREATEGLCRLYEIWRKETAECYWVHDRLHGTYNAVFDLTEEEFETENARRMAEQGAMGVPPEEMLLLEWRWGVDTFWRYYYLTPGGLVLDMGINPYWHEKPPFVWEWHEFFIGDVHPFVTDLIDTNKLINRLFATSDLMTKYAAKSLLFVPMSSVAEEYGYDLKYIEEHFADFNAVIPYEAARDGSDRKPTLMNSMQDALQPLNVVTMALRMTEQVSGVYGALQGQQPVAGTPAAMYAQQSQNSAVSLNGLFEAMNSFRRKRDKLNVQLMQQFYTRPRYVYDKESGKQLRYDPERVKHADVEIAISEGTDTPAYRMLLNDVLMQLKQFDTTGLLDLRGLVEVGNYPFKDKLLDYMNKKEQEQQAAMAQMAAAEGAVPQAQGVMPQAQAVSEAEARQATEGYVLNPALVRELMERNAAAQ